MYAVEKRSPYLPAIWYSAPWWRLSVIVAVTSFTFLGLFAKAPKPYIATKLPPAVTSYVPPAGSERPLAPGASPLTGAPIDMGGATPLPDASPVAGPLVDPVPSKPSASAPQLTPAEAAPAERKPSLKPARPVISLDEIGDAPARPTTARDDGFAVRKQ